MVVDIAADAKPIALFDNLFATFETGLNPPPDYFPHLTDEEEIQLLTDASTVYNTLKKFDKEFLSALHSGDPKKREIALRVDQEHRDLITQFTDQISFKRQAVEANPTLEIIREKYKIADEKIAEIERQSASLKPIEKAQIRLEEFKSVRGATDMDLTLTTTDEYLSMIPGSIQAENYMAHKDHGRQKFPEVFVRYWREAIHILENNFKTIGRNIPFRPGVEKFSHLMHNANLPLDIISANFWPLVRAVGERLNIDKDHTYAVKQNDISVTDKAVVIAELAIQNPDVAMIFHGDGGSDEVATEPPASDVTAFYFALRGGSFEKKLKAKGLLYFPYDSFEDVIQVYQTLGLLAPDGPTDVQSLQ